MSLQRPTSKILCLSQMRPGSSSLVHCRPMRLPVPRAAFASCGQKPKSFCSSTVRRRPIFRQLLASEIDGCIPLFASPDIACRTRSSRSLLQTSGSWSSRVRHVRRCHARRLGKKKAMSWACLQADLARSDDAENGAIDRTTSLRIPHGLSAARGGNPQKRCKGPFKQDDRPYVRCYRRDDQGPYEVDPSEDTRGESNAGSHLGARAGLRC